MHNRLKIIHTNMPDLYQNNHLKETLLVSSDYNLLKSKCDLIVQYTKKIDPNATIEAYDIKELPQDQEKISPIMLVAFENYHVKDPYPTEVKLNALKDNGYQFYVNVTALLPRPVKALYGERLTCKHASPIAGGLFPLPINLSDIESVLFDKKPDQILLTSNPKENIHHPSIRVGDIMRIGFDNDGQFVSTHEFIYLDEDICISANGVVEPMLIHLTQDVLMLYVHKSTYQLNVLRKQQDWHYSEELVNALVDFYKEYNQLNADHDNLMKHANAILGHIKNLNITNQYVENGLINFLSSYIPTDKKNSFITQFNLFDQNKLTGSNQGNKKDNNELPKKKY